MQSGGHEDQLGPHWGWQDQAWSQARRQGPGPRDPQHQDWAGGHHGQRQAAFAITDVFQERPWR